MEVLDDLCLVACFLKFSPLWPFVEDSEVVFGQAVSFVSVLKCVPGIDVDVVL